MYHQQDIGALIGIKLRLLKRQDLSLYLDHLLRLDEKTREQRFDHALSDDALDSHCRSLQKLGTRIVGAFLDEKMFGACEISQPIYNRRLVRELAFSIERDYQGLGLGSKLMAKSLRLVRPAKIKMYCQLSNLGMIGLAEKFGATINLKRDYVICDINSSAKKQPNQSVYYNQLDLMSFRDLVSINPYF